MLVEAHAAQVIDGGINGHNLPYPSTPTRTNLLYLIYIFSFCEDKTNLFTQDQGILDPQ